MEIEKKTSTVLEAAKMLGCSKGLIYDMMRKGSIPSLELGRRRVIPKKRFDEWLEHTEN